MPSLEDELRDESKLVKLDASELASFRALRLNQGCSDAVEKILLDAETWRKIEVSNVDFSGLYVLGLDLGSSHSMSAASAYFEHGDLDCFAFMRHEAY